MRSLLLGLDVSPRRLGWGLVDLVTGEPVACGCEDIDLPDHGWHHDQVRRALMNAYQASCYSDRGHPNAEIQAVYIEDTAKAGKYRQHDAGGAQRLVQAEVERRWPHAPVEYLKPSEWKKLAGLSGNASKTQVMDEACTRGERILGARAWGQDAADALLIAVAGQRRNGENWERVVERGEAA